MCNDKTNHFIGEQKVPVNLCHPKDLRKIKNSKRCAAEAHGECHSPVSPMYDSPRSSHITHIYAAFASTAAAAGTAIAVCSGSGATSF